MTELNPPYEGISMPSKWRDTSLDELPAGLRKRILRLHEESDTDSDNE